MLDSTTLKRKQTGSMYSLADVLRPAQFHCGRPSLVAVRDLKNFEQVVDPIFEEVEADPTPKEVQSEPVIEKVAVPGVEEDDYPAVTPKPKVKFNKKAPLVQTEDIEDEPCVTPKEKSRTRKTKKAD